MGVLRRTFTREFKLPAVRRLEAGISIAEVARGLEVNPNVLHRWRREFRQVWAMLFPVRGSGGGAKARSPNWSARWGSRRWRSIF